jgi:hypothetical protein
MADSSTDSPNARPRDKAASAPAPTASTAAPAASAPWPAGDLAALDFLWKTHGRLNEDARFADTKAAVVIMFASGLIASLSALKLHVLILSRSPLHWGFLEPLAAAGYILLTAGMCLAAWSMKPRLDRAHDRGFLFWDSIRGYPTSQEFWQAYRVQNAGTLNEHMAHHVYTLAGVCQKKYRLVGLGMWAFFLGALAAMAAFLLKDVVS